MTFRLYDVVKLKAPLAAALAPGGTLPEGSSGTVILVHEFPRRAYEVEFSDAQGKTLAVAALSDEDLTAE